MKSSESSSAGGSVWSGSGSTRDNRSSSIYISLRLSSEAFKISVATLSSSSSVICSFTRALLVLGAGLLSCSSRSDRILCSALRTFRRKDKANDSVATQVLHTLLEMVSSMSSCREKSSCFLNNTGLYIRPYHLSGQFLERIRNFLLFKVVKDRQEIFIFVQADAACLS
jgi:hypothetical protein